MSGGVEGFGSTTWWGFSPALDLAAVAPTPGEALGGKETRGGSGVASQSRIFCACATKGVQNIS